MKKFKRLLSQNAPFILAMALSGSQLIASEDQQRVKRASILSVLATCYDAAEQKLRITCCPEAIKTLEDINFEQRPDGWTSSIWATFGNREQCIEKSIEAPSLDLAAFKVYVDENTRRIMFVIPAQTSGRDRVET